MEEARLTVVGTDFEAEMICGLLRSEGIECYSRKTDLGAGSTGGMLTGFGQTEIIVGASDLEAAREVLGLDDKGCSG